MSDKENINKMGVIGTRKEGQPVFKFDAISSGDILESILSGRKAKALRLKVDVMSKDADSTLNRVLENFDKASIYGATPIKFGEPKTSEFPYLKLDKEPIFIEQGPCINIIDESLKSLLRETCDLERFNTMLNSLGKTIATNREGE